MKKDRFVSAYGLRFQDQEAMHWLLEEAGHGEHGDNVHKVSHKRERKPNLNSNTRNLLGESPFEGMLLQRLEVFPQAVPSDAIIRSSFHL